MLAKVLLVAGFICMAASGEAAARPLEKLADLTTFSPSSSDELEFRVTDGESKIGNTSSVKGPILQVCDKRTKICAFGYPGVAIALQNNGKLKFSLTSELKAEEPPMYDCMDKSTWRDNLGWQALHGLMNIHTHGLLVKPYVNMGASPSENMYGDYIFDCVTGAAKFQPSQGGHVVGNTMKFFDDLDVQLSPSSSVRGQPFGVNWFHPHVHGIAKAQVSLGMAGMILIGDPLSNLCFSVDAQSEKCDEDESKRVFSQTQVRNILLKDAQLIEAPGGNGVFWYNNADQDAGFCAGRETATDNVGACRPEKLDGMRTPDLTREVAVTDAKWVFTLNGQEYPEMTFDNNHPYQLLRLQNASANVTYRLSLRHSTSDDAVAPFDSQGPKFKILSMDGAGYIGAVGHRHVHEAREILLMPGSRADLMIAAADLCPKPCIKGAVYQLVTAGYQTGNEGNEADFWPQIALARIVAPNSGAALAVFSEWSAGQKKLMLNGAKLQKVPVKSIEENCKLLNVNNASKYEVRLAPGDKRRIYFGIYKNGEAVEDFVLGSTILHPDGTESDIVGERIGDKNAVQLRTMQMDGMPAMKHTQMKADLCVELGSPPEVWQLVNISNEVHNFHIHQVKFTVERNSDGDPVWRAQSLRDTQVVPEEIIFAGGEEDLQHDTIVVPRGSSSCLNNLMPTPEKGMYTLKLWNPQDKIRCDGSGQTLESPSRTPQEVKYEDVSGMIEVKIPFDGLQLEPTNGKPALFVYHCHILEHEDNGMMASIAVLPVGADPLQ